MYVSQNNRSRFPAECRNGLQGSFTAFCWFICFGIRNCTFQVYYCLCRWKYWLRNDWILFETGCAVSLADIQRWSVVGHRHHEQSRHCHRRLDSQSYCAVPLPAAAAAALHHRRHWVDTQTFDEPPRVPDDWQHSRCRLHLSKRQQTTASQNRSLKWRFFGRFKGHLDP